MDLILDSQFMLLYVLKIIRILFTYIALFMATKLYSPLYENAVYDSKANPPSLLKYLLFFVAFDVSLNAFLVVVLWLMKFLFDSEGNSFIVDKYLFNKFISEYIITMVIVLIIAYLLGRIITNKRYFKFKYEGLRAVRAYESMVFNVAIVIYLIPFFVIL